MEALDQWATMQGKGNLLPGKVGLKKITLILPDEEEE